MKTKKQIEQLLAHHKKSEGELLTQPSHKISKYELNRVRLSIIALEWVLQDDPNWKLE
jgi:hypothetical protein